MTKHKITRVWEFFKDHKRTYITGIFWLWLVDTIQMVQPRLLGYIIDIFQLGQMTTNKLIKFALLILLIGAVSGLARFFWRYYITGNSFKLDYSLRKDYFNHLLTLSPSFYNANKIGELMSIGINDINIVRMSLGISFLMFFDALYLIVLAIIMMLVTTNLKLTVLAGLTFPIIYLLTRFFNNQVYNLSRRSQADFARLTDFTRESYSGIRIIKAFNQEEESHENYKKVNQDNFDKNFDLIKVDGLFNPSIRFLYSISVLITIFLGGRQVIAGQISIGDFIAFNSYLAVLQAPVRYIGQILNSIQRGFSAIDRIEEVFEEESDIKEVKYPKEVSFEDRLTFENVDFSYPNSDSQVLKNISFELANGETLAILGETGAGKSTIADLILRLYDIDQGSIKIDGVDIRDLSFENLRTNIAYVPQDNFLFSQTIKYNIAFSQDYGEKIDKDGVIRASKQASLYDNINDFPVAFDTELGERGVSLSGGQRQRTNMARAFMKDSSILILDDSLSAVDTKTEEDILNSVRQMDYKIGKIIISHRISSIRDADKIIVLKDGQVVQRGRHEDLVNKDGIYREIYLEQELKRDVKNE